ncbi:uncharacterized protein N0V89_011984 [Didymosphaeria variabile]|uniref:F-box domain-containing protein n=1 Tax=Didymosphaeria variabile TaxID=1932322 RepID=A0A9W8XB81_9PLEO|nr:uncharacterized protein N0V89_011984 [Didymosphaeria variabile]KAJ4345849.1 hypothetical protein N0V89_011984 [Didymosphaeria variabile]
MATEPSALNNARESSKRPSPQAPATPEPPSSTFAELPLELRQLVYHHMLVDNGSEKVIKVALNDTQFRSESLENVAGAIRVSKSISNELLDYIFGMFAFSLSDLAPSSYSILQKFCDRIGKMNVEFIKEIIIPHLLSHDVDALQWVNFDAHFRQTSRWRVDVGISNRIFELQYRKLLDRLPSMKHMKVGLDWPCAINNFVQPHREDEPLGLFKSSFSINRHGVSVAVHPGLWWLLAELYARNVSFGIYWTDVREYFHVWNYERVEAVLITEEEMRVQRRMIVQVLSYVLESFGSRKTSSVSDLGTLPDDLFAYGIGVEYLGDGPRPQLYKALSASLQLLDFRGNF